VLVIAADYEDRELSLAARMALFAIAFLISVVSYKTVEDPIRRSQWSGQPTALLWPVSVGASSWSPLWGSVERCQSATSVERCRQRWPLRHRRCCIYCAA
jgi:hypothetical protein